MYKEEVRQYRSVWLGVGVFTLAGAVLGGSGWLQAADRGLVAITEVMWDGVEYTELFNAGTEAVELEGWTLTRQRREGEAEETLVEFGEDQELPAGSFLVVGKSASALENGVDVVVSGFVLHNDGNLLRLRDGAGLVVDSAGRLGSWFSGANTESGAAMERLEVGVNGELADNWQTAQETWRGRVGSAGKATTTLPTLQPSPEVTVPPGEVADYSGLTISEFLPNPDGSDAEGEFIELFNSGTDKLSLIGLTLDDVEDGSRPYRIAEGELLPGAYAVFWRSETGIALNNDGDEVRLLSGRGDVIATVSYGSEAKSGESWNRQDGKYVISTTATPGIKNTITAPATPTPRVNVVDEETESTEAAATGDFSNRVIIAAFLPNPVGIDAEGEYVEIENTDTRSLHLAGWQLDDAEGGSRAYGLPTEIVLGVGKRLRLARSETGIALNNTEDAVRLLDPAGKVVAEVLYEDPKEGVVYTRQADGTYAPLSTAGEVLGEKVVAPFDPPAGGLRVKEARERNIGETVTVEGIVIAPPGVLGARVMYIADIEGPGLQVYRSAVWPDEVHWGEVVRVRGEMSEVSGERRLKMGGEVEIEMVGPGEMPQAHLLDTGAVGEGWEGSYIEVAGAVVRSSGDIFYLDDGSGETRIVLKETTGITKPRLKKGMQLRIRGIVSETRSGYRILPRVQEDFAVVGGVLRSSTGSERPEGIEGRQAQVESSSAGTADDAAGRIAFADQEVFAQPDAAQAAARRRTATRNTFVFLGAGLAAVQLIGGIREEEGIWKLFKRSIG